jgi:hypothetical protein
LSILIQVNVNITSHRLFRASACKTLGTLQYEDYQQSLQNGGGWGSERMDGRLPACASGNCQISLTPVLLGGTARKRAPTLTRVI